MLIYALIDPRDQRVRYVGKSSSGLRRPESRWKTSWYRKHDYTQCGFWVRELDRLDLVPIVKILEDFGKFTDRHLFVENYNLAERRWISKMREEGYELLNRTDGGEGDFGFVCSHRKTLSKTHRENIGKSVSGKKNSFYGKRLIGSQNPFFGHRHSLETKEAISKANSGKPNARRRSVKCINDGKTYASATECARAYDIPSSTVFLYARTRALHRKSGLRFCYIDLENS